MIMRDTLDNEKRNAFEAMLTKRNLVVEANAGTGKTYLIKAFIGHILESSPSGGCPTILVCTFNTDNAKELNKFILKKIRERRVKGDKREILKVKASTFHKLGNENIRGGLSYYEYTDNLEVQKANTYDDTLKDTFNRFELSKAIEAYQLIKAMCGQMLVNGEKAGVDTVERYLDEHNYEFKHTSNTDAAIFFSAVINKIVKNKKQKSSTDMLFLSGVNTYSKDTCDKYDYVIVDEQQDMNLTQINIVSKYCSHETKLSFIGDKKQRINGFQGALGFDKLKDIIIPIRGDFDVVSLKTTYRNSEVIVEFVNKYFRNVWDVKGITNRPNGVVEFCGGEIGDKISELATNNEKDLAIISYSNKGLMECFGVCILNRIKPYYTAFNESEKATIYKSVIKIINEYNCELDDIIENVSNILKNMLLNIYKTRQQIKDTIEYKIFYMCKVLLESFKSMGVNSKDAIIESIKEIDSFDKAITLTTTHKSKGMTFKNTIIVNTVSFGKVALDDLETAKCLIYVAFTRAVDGLYIYGSKSKSFAGLLKEAEDSSKR